jgi:hypothetical protein
MSKAEFQAALFSARRYMEMREGGDEWVVAAGPLSCATCGHVFIAKGDENVPAADLSGRLLAHVCGGPPVSSDPASGEKAEQ